MTNEQVKEILKKHLDNITIVKLRLLDLEDFDEHILEALCLPSVILSEVPRSVTNKINSITETVALNYKQTQVQLKKDIQSLNRDIERVEIALEGLKKLSQVDAFLVQKKWVEGLSWHEVGREFTKHFYYISDKSMSRKCKKALKKLSFFLS